MKKIFVINDDVIEIYITDENAMTIWKRDDKKIMNVMMRKIIQSLERYN